MFPSFNVFHYRMSISGRDYFYVTECYHLVTVYWFIIIINHAFINILFLHKTSETSCITLSQKNDSLFIVMVSYYCDVRLESRNLRVRRAELHQSRAHGNTKYTVTMGFDGAFGDISIVTTFCYHGYEKQNSVHL
jgi:hypothetical protein